MRNLKPALGLMVVMTLLLGVIYPFIMTAVGRWVFPEQAAGSLVYRGETLIGSSLIGQSFSTDRYFWGRPSATAPQPYNGLASGASNLGPLNPALIDQVDANVRRVAGGAQPGAGRPAPVPVDLVTASASGLDPDISVAAAEYQAARVAHARNIALAAVQARIAQHQHAALFGIIGEPRINVLELNLAIDAIPP